MGGGCFWGRGWPASSPALPTMCSPLAKAFRQLPSSSPPAFREPFLHWVTVLHRFPEFPHVLV